MKKLLLVIAFCFLAVGRLSAYSSPGKPTGFVNDYAGLLSPTEKQNLETQLGQLYASTSAQVAVVTIKNLDGDTIENYAVKLFEDWGIGTKGEDNGVLFLTALEDRKLRIEVGYGLEGILTDAESSAIIRHVVTPAYKQEQYEAGIVAGTYAVVAAIEGELPVIPGAGTTNDDEKNEPGVGILILAYIVLQTITGILSRTKSWWLGGILGGILGSIVTLVYGFMVAGLLAFGVLVPLGLLVDYLISKNPPKNSDSGHPWWFGNSSFGGGKSSGGFGGFGGGRSGGGGSSGSW